MSVLEQSRSIWGRNYCSFTEPVTGTDSVVILNERQFPKLLLCAYLWLPDHIQSRSTFIEKPKISNSGVNSYAHHQICMTRTAYACRNVVYSSFIKALSCQKPMAMLTLPFMSHHFIHREDNKNTIDLLFPHCTITFISFTYFDNVLAEIVLM